MPRKNLSLTLFLTTNAYATTLPWSPANELRHPDKAEKARNLATYILENEIPQEICWTDLSNDKKGFDNPDIKYQACRVQIGLGENIYRITVLNQNEQRKDETRGILPSEADYLAISVKEKKQKDFTLIGMDDYLDGWADVGQQKEFYDTIEKIKEYVEKK
ncbi:MAG TPA: hypothetical protein HA233_04690 [Nanoarchaeota archaeon]|nr:hypothetical protein [Nanoarchaeota archaeon]HIJ04651.1 hypothetical protein [Nanoarchaeota archaeon]